jgi:membrane-associated phospholipid phosphatase
VLLISVLTVLFAALTWAVMAGWPFGGLDHDGRSLADEYFRGSRNFLRHYVLLGQRGPTVKIAAVYFIILAIVRRTPDALIYFIIAELGNNLLVGAVKLTTGRWGPLVTRNVHDILAGGDIFPSGHVANAVVLFGVLALTAHRFRRTLIALTIWISVSVGLATVLLSTHWVTDVLGGWLAGGIVLACLPRHEGLTRRLVVLPRELWLRLRRSVPTTD